MRSWCFDSVATTTDGVTSYDREYGSADIREVVGKLIGNGVYATPATNMQVVANTGLTVKVQPGCCWIKGAYGCVDTAETLTLEASNGGRTDLIVARFSTDLSYRSIRVMVVKGTDGNSAAPALTRTATNYDIQLAQIIVRSGASTISQSDITDMRFNKSVCGIVTGVIDQIDATDLFAQYNTAFNEKLSASQSTLDAKLAAFQSSFDTFFDSMQTTLSGDVAGNLLTLINNHAADKDNPHGVTKEQVGLDKVLNEKQYCRSNPPPTGDTGWLAYQMSYGTLVRYRELRDVVYLKGYCSDARTLTANQWTEVGYIPSSQWPLEDWYFTANAHQSGSVIQGYVSAEDGYVRLYSASAINSWTFGTSYPIQT